MSKDFLIYLMAVMGFSLFLASCSSFSGPSCLEDDENVCGGCNNLLPSPGDLCGPCGLDSYECTGTEEIECSGQTSCSIGEYCEHDSDCDVGICQAKRCAPQGYAFIPAGRYLRGSPDNERGRMDGETQHTLTLTHHFLMQTTPVTQGEWEELMGYNPAFFNQCGDDCPVESISWYEALAYANELSKADGFAPCYDLSECTGAPGTRFQCSFEDEAPTKCSGYRLPTEAEWEYAYRADTTSAYFFGETETRSHCEQPELNNVAVFCGNCETDYGQSIDCSNDGARANMPSACGTSPVGTKAPNPWGLYDMAGNVSELLWDDEIDYGTDPLIDPAAPAETGRRKAIRGAGFCGHRDRLRAADRKFIPPGAKREQLGVRLVRTLQRASEEEIERDGSCNNGCGGCEPLDPSVDTPCGPCGLDRYQCDGTDKTICSGFTECQLGAECIDDNDCDTGNCSNGYCSLAKQSFIPAGRYLRGSPRSETRRSDDETLHDVTLTRHVFMDQTPITQYEWANLMGFNPSRFKECGDQCPVESITWTESLAFANARSRTQGLEECYDLSECEGQPGNRLRCPADLSFDLDCEGYRLPTDAEWEYAYRADTQTTYYAGTPTTATSCEQPLLDEIARYCGNCDVDYDSNYECGDRICGTSPVAEMQSNEWGLFDMSGNVGEFVWDAFEPHSEEALEDPTIPHQEDSEVTVRNHGFCGQMQHLRGARRHSVPRIAASSTIGFRLVRTFRQATVEEIEREGSCSNGCGGCFPVLPPPGTPCGPCGGDEYQCVSEQSTECDGATECNAGEACNEDSECTGGPCSNGYCSIENFVYVPAGVFIRGSVEDELGRGSGETQHQVTITRPFLMEATPTTQQVWSQVMGYSPAYFSECGPDCPAENFSWREALAYANARSELQGLERCYDLTECSGEPGSTFQCPNDLTFDLDCEGYRLPTEAEWEYAYRANTSSMYYNGEATSTSTCDQPLLQDIAQFCGNCEVDYEPSYDCSNDGQRPQMPNNCGTATVGGREANPWGLYDMSGNVEEFTWDIEDEYPQDPVIDPIGPTGEGTIRVTRGGSFCGHMARLRAADRKSILLSASRPGTGVRLVRSMPDNP